MIERRELLMAGAGLAAAGTLAVPAAGQQHPMEGMAMSMTDCIDDCVASHRMCLETATWLTKRGGASATASLIAMLNDCAELCQASANSMLREYPPATLLSPTRADALERCAPECRTHVEAAPMTPCSHNRSGPTASREWHQ